jgi:hypothetical protein
MAILNGTPGPPPKKTAISAPKKPVTVDNPEKTRQDREDALNGLWTAAAAFCMMGNQWADAGAISQHGPNVSKEAAALSLKYEKVGNALDALANVSPFANLIGAVMPMVMQIAANHKMVPAQALAGIGVKDPGVLESQMRVEAQRQVVEYQKYAAQEKANLEAELASLNVSEG